MEDCPQWPNERVRAEFGKRVADLLGWLSKPSKAEYPEKADRDRIYHARLASAPRDVLIIKLPDRLHNMLTLAACDPEKRQRKLEETRRYYLPLAEREILLIHELEDALAAIEATLPPPVIAIATHMPHAIPEPSAVQGAPEQKKRKEKRRGRELPSDASQIEDAPAAPDCGGGAD